MANDKENKTNIEEIIQQIATEASVPIQTQRLFGGQLGVWRTDRPHDTGGRGWHNLEGYNLLGQIRIVTKLLEDIE